jgi:hypothetical protein
MTTIPQFATPVTAASDQLSTHAQGFANACDQLLESVMVDLAGRFSATALKVTPDEYGEPCVELAVTIDDTTIDLYELDEQLANLVETAVLTVVALEWNGNQLRINHAASYWPSRTVLPPA